MQLPVEEERASGVLFPDKQKAREGGGRGGRETRDGKILLCSLSERREERDGESERVREREANSNAPGQTRTRIWYYMLLRALGAQAAQPRRRKSVFNTHDNDSEASLCVFCQQVRDINWMFLLLTSMHIMLGSSGL
jgi:hypothetical protein